MSHRNGHAISHTALAAGALANAQLRPMEVSDAEALAELETELVNRQAAYPRMIASGQSNLTALSASRKLAALRRAIEIVRSALDPDELAAEAAAAPHNPGEE